MSARRYMLRLYRHGAQKKQTEANLDPTDDARLREVLEALVMQVAGTLRLDLSAGWKLVVYSPGGGRIWARVTVDGSGRTVVQR